MPIRLTTSSDSFLEVPNTPWWGGLKFLLLLPAFRNVREILQKKNQPVFIISSISTMYIFNAGLLTNIGMDNQKLDFRFRDW